MIKRLCTLIITSTCALSATIELTSNQPAQQIVLTSRRYIFEKYPGSFNPSIVEIDGGFLLSFRYSPDEQNQPWLSYIGIVPLDESLNPLADPKLLNTRQRRSKTPSQTEDARFFTYLNRLFIIYNDSVDEIFFDYGKRRDMFISELTLNDQGYQLSSPLKLRHEEHYNKFLHQKNWIPFEWNKTLQISYSLFPHEVLETNLKNGNCRTVYNTEVPLNWNFGKPRGSTTPLLIDGEYLAFFHSSSKTQSAASNNAKIWHYFMGAYTFSAEPPFAITQMSEKPIIGENFYTMSSKEKRVVFPGGFVVKGPHIHLAYGKDDCEIWIATLDKDALMRSLKPIAEEAVPTGE